MMRTNKIGTVMVMCEVDRDRRSEVGRGRGVVDLSICR